MAEFIPLKWKELNANKPFMENIIKVCKLHKEGGILWLKYKINDSVPECAFIPKNDWEIFTKLGNFILLTADYDPSIHYILCLSVEGHCQLARLNYM